MKLVLTCFAALTLSIMSLAQDAVPTKEYNLTDGIAIKGYDPVAYFTEKRAVKGIEKYSYTHNGAKYYFSSEANKAAYIAMSESYEPQYGGWCAYAMGEAGEKVEIDPKNFKITNGKLYLFYNFYFTNTLTLWNKNETNLRKQADINWYKLKK